MLLSETSGPGEPLKNAKKAGARKTCVAGGRTAVAAPSLAALQAGTPELESALEEAEFFATRGLYDDARAILDEQLVRLPNHPLLLERLAELDRQLFDAKEQLRRTTEDLEAARAINRELMQQANRTQPHDHRARAER